MSKLNSFRNRLLILFIGLSFTLGLCIALYTGKIASEQITNTSGQAIHNYAKNISDTLGNSLTEREREIILLSQSPFIAQADFNHPQVLQQLNQVKKSYKYYAWLGIANPSGEVVVAADQLLEGADVSERDWFVNGINQVYLGDVHKAVLLAKKIKAINPLEPLRFIDFATPIYDPNNYQVKGVLAAHADWSWAGQVLESALPLHASEQGIEVFIVNKNGEILYPFKSIGQVTPPKFDPYQTQYFVNSWGEETKYLTTDVPVVSDTNMDMGWHIIIRQPIDTALSDVRTLQHRLIIIGLLVSLLLFYITYRLANRFSYPIEKLAESAHSLEQGQEDISFDVDTSIEEIKGLSNSLKSMTHTLLTQKHQLLDINTNLEKKVQERTQALELANIELEKLARHDPLTGLYNRRAFNEYIEILFTQYSRTQQAYAILLLDIDYFKKVNDTFGHEIGDHVLIKVAQILLNIVRKTDFTARFGGEEFIILLPATSKNDAIQIAEKIRYAISEADIIDEYTVTTSIGVSIIQDQDSHSNDAIRRADKYLYMAKEQGRNRVISEN